MKALLKSRVLHLAMVVALAGAVGLLLGGCSSDEPETADPHAGHAHAEGEHVDAEVADIVAAAVEAAGVKWTCSMHPEVMVDSSGKCPKCGMALIKAEPLNLVAVVEQTMCPVMGKAIDKSIFVEHEGQKVYFCCPPCKEKFTAAPADYMAKLPQFAK